MTVSPLKTGLWAGMMRRIVTRLIIANLIPVAIKAGKKAFSKRKKPARVEPNNPAQNLDQASNLDPVETVARDMTDKNIR